MSELDKNTDQNLAVQTIEGPVLIIAGPGTGKTYTLVKRIENLILNHGASAEKEKIEEDSLRKFLLPLLDEWSSYIAIMKLNFVDMYLKVMMVDCS